MKIIPNPFIKRNNDQIEKEREDKIVISIMVWCPKYKIKVNPEMKENCLGCIFGNKEKKECWYNDWHPGLKKGKNEQNKILP